MMNFGGISLGIKSEKTFNNIEFKFKKMKFKNVFFGVILLKLDETIYSCFIALNQIKNKSCLEKLMNLDYFNLIVFNKSKENKIYRILNNLKNQILFCLPENICNSQDIVTNNIKIPLSADKLWNN